MKKNHHFNYQPVLNQYQTIVLRNKFRQIINDYYQINLQLLSVQLPIIYELDQNNYFDLLYSINFSINQNNKTYQLISDHRANLVRFLQAHDLIAENGVYYNGWFFDKQSDQSKNNIINEYDFLELKIRIVDTNRLFIVDQFNEF